MTDTLDAANAGSADDLGFDPEALKAKYRAERDKRLRAEGSAQYQDISGRFAHYLDDPYVTPGFSRAPLTDEVEVVVVGGGFGGLLTGARRTTPVDLDALAEAMARISVLAHRHADRFASVEINPLVALADRAIALDGLIVSRA